MNTAELSCICKQERRDIINMTANAGSGHPGGSLSATELMTTLFFRQMRIDPKNPKDPNRDRFVLSKGHSAPCYYAVLAERGFISRDEFTNFRQLHSILQGRQASGAGREGLHAAGRRRVSGGTDLGGIHVRCPL